MENNDVRTDFRPKIIKKITLLSSKEIINGEAIRASRDDKKMDIYKSLDSYWN